MNLFPGNKGGLNLGVSLFLAGSNLTAQTLNAGSRVSLVKILAAACEVCTCYLTKPLIKAISFFDPYENRPVADNIKSFDFG